MRDPVFNYLLPDGYAIDHPKAAESAVFGSIIRSSHIDKDVERERLLDLLR